MIERVRVLVPVFNLTSQALGVKAEKDEGQGRLVLRVGNPRPDNLVEPEKYAILSYTTDAAEEVTFQVSLFKEDGLNDDGFGLCATQPVPDAEADSVVMLLEGNLSFSLPYRMGGLVLTPKCTNSEPVVISVKLGKLVKGWLRASDPQK